MKLGFYGKNREALTQTLTALLVSLFSGAILVWCVGESPIQVLRVFSEGAWGTPYDLGLSLYAALPLICTGLAISLGIKLKLINIGAEGQLIVGALAAAIAGIYGPREVWTNRAAAFLAAMLAGWLWGAILGWLRAYRRSHEVVAGIMLNYLAYGLTSYLTLSFLHNPHSQNPETIPIADTLRIPALDWFQGAAIGWHALIPIAALLLYDLVFRYTRVGFNLHACGAGEKAAVFAGLKPQKAIFHALATGGLIAGMFGFIEVFGNSGRFVVGFSPGYGFTGIAVALLARGRPLGILVSALAFGAIYKGALNLDMETQNITRDFAMILQAVLVLLISCKSINLKKLLPYRREKSDQHA